MHDQGKLAGTVYPTRPKVWIHMQSYYTICIYSSKLPW
jgi:hypothetical protein